MSAVGSGAILITYPDAPISLVENYSSRSATSLGLTWSAGASNGGAAIFDYTVSFDQGTGVYIVLASGVLNTNYTAINLVPGLVYKFKV
jgi:type II secretory pathway component GspD/PulD (secretin)